MKTSKRIISVILTVLMIVSMLPMAISASAAEGINIGTMATPTASSTAGHNNLNAINDGELFSGAQSSCWGTWGTGTPGGTYWVQLDWAGEVSIDGIGIQWFIDQSGSQTGGMRTPTSTTLTYLNADGEMVDVPGYKGVGLEATLHGNNSAVNETYFDNIKTTRIRLSMQAYSDSYPGISEFFVYSNDTASIVESIANGLTIPANNAIVADSIDLPYENSANYAVSWVSSDPSVISINEDGITATVTRPAEGEADATVTLTGTVDNGEGVTSSKDIVCTVKALGTASIVVDMDINEAFQDIPSTLYGVFFEDINHALDGGINAELIENGSFEMLGMNNGRFSFGNDANTLANWSKVAKDGAAGSASVVTDNPLNDNNTKSAKVTVSNAGSGYGYGIANNGFGTNIYNNTRASMPIVGGVTYDFDGYLKGDYVGSIRVFLEAQDGTLNSNIVEIPAITADWQQYTGSLTALNDVDSRLTIVGDAVGTFYVDFWNMRPEASEMWRNGAAGGLNKNLMTALENLSPKFLRFPGGCASEGMGSKDRLYNWKNTVGERVQRKQMAGYWDSLMSFDIGYYEYMLICEELGAEAIPVLNAGVSCQFRTPLYQADLVTEMPQFIDDALDFIEFCNGDSSDPTQEWAMLRAEMGHPEPFNLKYISLGNENWGTNIYWPRFDLMYNAVKEAYPEMVVVTTAGPYADGGDLSTAWSIVNEKYTDTVVDEHYYTTSDWMLQNTGRYDNTRYYKDNGAKVFIGEYAANKDPGNTHNAALCEAVYMTSIERNSDTVIMASYAPFLCKADLTNGTTWEESDLIWFTGRTTALTASYYVQQLYANNVGNKLIKSEAASNKLTAYSASVDTTNGNVYCKYVNRNDYPIEVRFNVENAPEVEERNAVISYITSDNLYGINTVNDLEQTPAPVTYVLEDCGESIDIVIPKYAVVAVKFTSDTETTIITPANMTALKASLANAASKVESEYTTESWTALEMAVAEGQALVDMASELTSEDQAVVNAAKAAIDTAISNLVISFKVEYSSKTYVTGDKLTFTVKVPATVEDIAVTSEQNIADLTKEYKDVRGQRTFTVSLTLVEVGEYTIAISDGTNNETITAEVAETVTRPSVLGTNVATLATGSASYVTGWNSTPAANDGKVGSADADPTKSYRQVSEDAAWGTWGAPDRDFWYKLTWENPVEVDSIDVLWHFDNPLGAGQGVEPPVSATLTYLNADGETVPVENCSIIGNEGTTSANVFNYARFDAVTTTELTLHMTITDGAYAGIVEWMVYGTEVGDTTALKDLYDRAIIIDTTEWDAELAQAIEDALLAANAVLIKEKATQSEIDEAYTALENAVNAGYDVDKTALIEILAEAEKASTEGWNAAEIAALEKAVTNGAPLVDSLTTTQAAVDAAVAAIRKALDTGYTVDKAVLLNNIRQAGLVDTTGWTDATAQALNDAANAGVKVYASATSTQVEVDAAVAAIRTAITNYLYAFKVSVNGDSFKSGDDIVFTVLTTADNADIALTRDGKEIGYTADVNDNEDQYVVTLTTKASFVGAGTFELTSADFSEKVTVNVASVVTAPEVLGDNLALTAKPSASYCAGWNTVNALNDNQFGADGNGNFGTVWGTWPQITNTDGSDIYVQYDWEEAVTFNAVNVKWFNDQVKGATIGGVQIPDSAYVEYLNADGEWVAVTNASVLDTVSGYFNYMQFDKVTSKGLRVYVTQSEPAGGVGMQEWQVYNVDAKMPTGETSVELVSVNGETGTVYALVDEAITFVIKTTDDVENIGLANEAGAFLGKKSVSVAFDEDGNKIWTITASIGTKGSRTISVYYNAGEGFVASDATASLVITKTLIKPAEVEMVSVSAPEIAQVKTPFTFTVVVKGDVSALGLFNEKGAGISKSVVDKVDNGDGTYTWTLKASVNSVGDRKFTVRANTTNGWSDGVDFAIKIARNIAK